jgi:hypothetical protein
LIRVAWRANDGHQPHNGAASFSPLGRAIVYRLRSVDFANDLRAKGRFIYSNFVSTFSLS